MRVSVEKLFREGNARSGVRRVAKNIFGVETQDCMAKQAIWRTR